MGVFAYREGMKHGVTLPIQFREMTDAGITP
jgi:hypothetical protein